MMQAPDWFTTAVNEAKARVAQWPPELQQIASASLPSLAQQLAHEKHQADRIAELERECEALRKDAQWRPRFDVMEPEQERLAIQFCEEIAGRRGEKGRAPDPVRLLEMAEALYKAEADAALKEQSKCVELWGKP